MYITKEFHFNIQACIYGLIYPHFASSTSQPFLFFLGTGAEGAIEGSGVSSCGKGDLNRELVVLV